MWDATTGTHVRVIAAARVLTFGRDGSLFATDANGAVSGHQPSDGDLISALAGVYARRAALSPDGTRIAVVTPNRSAALMAVAR